MMQYFGSTYLFPARCLPAPSDINCAHKRTMKTNRETFITAWPLIPPECCVHRRSVKGKHLTSGNENEREPSDRRVMSFGPWRSIHGAVFQSPPPPTMFPRHMINPALQKLGERSRLCAAWKPGENRQQNAHSHVHRRRQHPGCH